VRVTPRSRTATDHEASAELIADLAKAGLVSVEMDDDGAVWYTLTAAGQKVARQMAMRRDTHVLVLLDALFGESEHPN
jgi:DNA-binding MarR family transcriptional regulator